MVVKQRTESRAVSRLESDTLKETIKLLGVKKSSPDPRDILDAYNSKMIEMSPLNRNLYSSSEKVSSAEAIAKKRAEFKEAYILASNGTSSSDNYDIYLNMFNRIHQRVEENRLIAETEAGLTKEGLLNQSKLNDTYLDSESKSKYLMKLTERGFAKQPLPNSVFIEKVMSKRIFPNSLLINSIFDEIYILKERNHGLWATTDSFGNKINDGSILGKFIKDELVLDKKEGLFAGRLYLLGEFSGKSRSYEDFLEDSNIKLYEKVFGFSPPEDKELSDFLKKIHKLDTRSYSYSLKSVSKEDLSYPLNDEVFEIYCAAEDSYLFKKEGDKLEFLILEKDERRPIDPILNGKILGGLNFPICWWI